MVRIRAHPPEASRNRLSVGMDGLAIESGGCTPRRAWLMNGPSKWIPTISARGEDGAPLLSGLRMYRAMPSRLLQVWSVGAVTVVATRVVVPNRATVRATVSRASGLPSITSCPPAPWICTSTKPGTIVRPVASISFAPAGSCISSRRPTRTIRPSSMRMTAAENSSRGVRIRAHSIAK